VCIYVEFRSGGSGGKAFGDGGEREREMWIIIGLVGTVTLLGTLAYYEMGYKEIAWKEFVNK
jgi:AFG3 family protein